MHGKFALLAASLMTLCMSGAAHATDLSVTASVTPSACALNLANGGVYHFGDRLFSELETHGGTDLPITAQNFDIQCQWPILVGLRAPDNRASSSPRPGLAYGLGQAAGSNIGGYLISSTALGLVVDGAMGMYLESTDEGASWSPIAFPFLDPAGIAVLSFATTGSQPQPISRIAGSLFVAPTILPKDMLDSTRLLSFDGSATLELVYL